jgi:hypothetical protein
MRARIYQPPQPATQSGRANGHGWMLEFIPATSRRPDFLMGWIGGGDTQTQVRLNFETQEEAVAYAQRAGIDYEVESPPVRRFRPKAYADNFRYNRIDNWTH